MSAWVTVTTDEVRPATVDSCLTGDELLDQQALRDMLRATWDSSNTNAVPSGRREMKSWLFEDSTGLLHYQVTPDPRNTPCGSWGAPNALLGVFVGESHTHPFHPRDTLPSNCAQTQSLPPGVYGLYDVKKYGGASDSDIVAFHDDSLAAYIVDMDSIYAYPAGVTLKTAKAKKKSYPRVNSVTGCILP